MGYGRKVGALTLAGFLAAGPATAATSSKCAKPAEVTAIQVAAIQQELMVAALTCDQVSNFNAFQTGFSKELRASDATLEKMFKRVFGGRPGEDQYHAFKTRLANNSSRRSIHDNPGYCHEAADAFAAALTSARPTLAAFVSNVTVHDDSPVNGCDVRVAVNLKNASGGLQGPAVLPKPKPLMDATAGQQ